jgi:hypothetical protein
MQMEEHTKRVAPKRVAPWFCSSTDARKNNPPTIQDRMAKTRRLGRPGTLGQKRTGADCGG